MPTETTTADLEKHLRTLGLPMGSTLDEIKKRHRFLVSVMHEDVVAEHQKEEAKKAMIDVNAAWSAIDAWFKAHSGVKETPAAAENTQTTGGAQQAGPAPGDVEDFESFEQRTAERFGQQGVSLEELDKKRRKNLAVRERRNFVFQARVTLGVIVAVMMLNGACNAPSAQSLHDMDNSPEYQDRANRIHANQNLAFFTLLAYVGWCFIPAARKKTEEWIEKAGDE